MQWKTLKDVSLEKKRVLVRMDFNVPLKNGLITNDARVRAAVPTIEHLLSSGVKQIILMSHLGRPKAGKFDPSLSLKPVSELLSKIFNRHIALVRDYLGVDKTEATIVLLENTRFLEGEKENDPKLSKRLAGLADVFVMDAFATAHRAEASTCGVIEYIPVACAGLLLERELKSLEQVMKNPAKPLLAIVGGAKVSTKLPVLDSLTRVCDDLIVGGGIANTFLMAKGFPVGRSLVEKDLVPEAKRLMDKVSIPLPVDVIVAESLSDSAVGILKAVEDVKPNEMILDIGTETAKLYAEQIKKAKTVMVNGPVGVFEIPAFAEGTRAVFEAVAQSDVFSLAGGGDTVAAIDQFNLSDQFGYISTGGGAFLEYVEGKSLPAVVALMKKVN